MLLFIINPILCISLCFKLISKKTSLSALISFITSLARSDCIFFSVFLSKEKAKFIFFPVANKISDNKSSFFAASFVESFVFTCKSFLISVRYLLTFSIRVLSSLTSFSFSCFILLASSTSSFLKEAKSIFSSFTFNNFFSSSNLTSSSFVLSKFFSSCKVLSSSVFIWFL